MEGIERTASSTDSTAVFDAAMEVASSLTATTSASTARPSTVESSADATSSGGSAASVSAASAASAVSAGATSAPLSAVGSLRFTVSANARRPVAASRRSRAPPATHSHTTEQMSSSPSTGPISAIGASPHAAA